MSSRCDEFWKPPTVRLTRHATDSPWPSMLSSWLAPAELDELSRFRAPSRRRDWLSGRWCAKQLLSQVFSEDTDSLLQWQILTRSSLNRGCRPAIFRNGIRQAIDLSLAHCESVTIAVTGQRDTDQRDTPRIGVDAVDRAELPDSFASTWFSSTERCLLQRHRWLIAAGWAAKEAVFKACNNGESFRPGRVQIVAVNADGCRVRYETRYQADVRINVGDDAIIAIARTTSNVPDCHCHSAQRSTSAVWHEPTGPRTINTPVRCPDASANRLMSFDDQPFDASLRAHE